LKKLATTSQNGHFSDAAVDHLGRSEPHEGNEGCFANTDGLYRISGEECWSVAVTQQEVIASYLALLKHEAEGRVGHPLHRAIIVVPTYSSDFHRRVVSQVSQC
jgi:molecular chaperone DnaK (HSP70)